ncbi:glucuronate isomerase [Microbacterium radiodurans]|uniref:Uronate isomerase n=1 Tax=Microbacterium radiodurans TaxID=661398 RepID=A0A5J5IVE7_9MICO|nr:glucuronate isomerase [Microbacterium radiodurans]KAA9089111.1 glucuronate isomerase [Microbacterium radiodurans]
MTPSSPVATTVLHPDRLLPADDATRAIARDLYDSVADAPIISPHGHVSPDLLREDRPFADPAELFIVHDHYVTRILRSAGVDLADLGAGGGPYDPREVWRAFASRWELFAGTASGYWLRDEFVELFGLREEPSADRADAHFDAISGQLRLAEYRPRALFERFAIDVLATTDDPLDDLSAHRELAADATLRGRVLPTFRPDAYLDPQAPSFVSRTEALAAWSGSPVADYDAYLDGLRARREYFIAHGAVSADHGVRQPFTVELEHDEAARLYRRAVSGRLSEDEAEVFAGHMLLMSAEMSVRDGLVMTVHPGVLRNHSTETFAAYGPDTGHDIPVATEYTRALRPLLQRFGTAADFHLILFTVDETVYSREIAPLAGFYPSVFIGAPWWFLDAPDAIQRFRSATTETAGFYNGSGFIDDTRAFLSIPARHDAARRSDAGFLARYVREGRLSIRQAERIALDLVDAIPRRAFKL